jgi:quercetin dioxygenase-like cupin family protein
MNNKQYSQGDIIVIERGESTDFRSITDSITVVVKTPAAINDKYTELPF